MQLTNLQSIKGSSPNYALSHQTSLEAGNSLFKVGKICVSATFFVFCPRDIPRKTGIN
jgi:hypothetical protein